jgi:hypothetical protein
MNRRLFLHTIVLSSGTLLSGKQSHFFKTINMSDIRVLMIYNNAGNDERLTNAWGLSLWLEHKDFITSRLLNTVP